MTTTDNGSNFVKAFSIFSASEEQEDSQHAEDAGTVNKDEECSFEDVFEDLSQAIKQGV